MSAAIAVALTVALGSVAAYRGMIEADASEREVCARAGMKLLRVRDLPWGSPARFCIESGGQAWSFETFAGGGR